jgi:UDP-N-acetylmuramoyl-tripeptide--D-alanyl-D-alanine ligase
MGRASTADLFEAVVRAGSVTTDTRNAPKGSVFFALKGERFNGNDYAVRALELGCGKVVVDEERPEFQGPDFLLVEDVLTSLQEVARMHRRTWDFPVFGLTGSNGKTTTKELIHAVVQQAFPGARATRGNLNNEIGVPLTLLEIPADAGFAVIEMGANAQREIARLAEIAEPTHGLITNIGKAHLEGFGGPEGVKAGKRELFQYVGATGGTVFVHAGNPVLREISEGLTRVLFGTAEHPPVGKLEDTSEGPVLRWTGPDGRAHGPVAMHLSGDHNLENVLAAIAVGLHFGVTAEQCTLAVSGYQPRNNRSEWRQTPRNSVLLDAYNANPSSMEHAIAHFAGLPQLEKAPGFVVLGDMAELGEYSPQEHARIAALFEETGLEGMCVGPEFAAVVSGKGNVSSCLSPEEAREVLAAKGLTGRTVLLKGSRSSALESLLDVL